MMRRHPSALPVRGLLLVLATLLASTSALANPAADRQLQEAARSYEKGAYKQVIKQVTPLLYPTIQLSVELKVIKAHKLLGIAQVFEKNTAAAAKEFTALLSLRPDYQLDSLVDPEAAVELFEKVKRDSAERLRKIRKRIADDRRREQEARRRAAERLRQAALQTVIERSRVERSVWVNFMPFGAGQFQNGHRTKGYLLLGLQAAAGAVSLGSAIYFRAVFSGTITRGSAEERAAERTAVTQVVSGALFFAALGYGIIDALVYYEPETIRERRYKRKIVLAPIAGPESVGVGLSARFH